MEDIQTSTFDFSIPIILAYASACGIYFLLRKQLWQTEEEEAMDKKHLDLVLAFVAAIGILLIGQVYSAGYLIPKFSDIKLVQAIVWMLNNVLIFSPVFIVLLVRKQSLKSIYISFRQWHWKVLFGLLTAIVGSLLFVGLRGEFDRIPSMINHAFELEAISNFPAVFFEGVAIAFLFVRIKWATNLQLALIIPSLLFAVAHLPEMIADGHTVMHMSIISLVTISISVLVLFTIDKSKDIIWLGIFHYFLDIAIAAF